MSQSITSQTLSLPALSKPELPDESITRVAAVGWVIIAIFFGLFGTWAAIAPLKGAVVANGLIKVEGNRKSVQPTSRSWSPLWSGSSTEVLRPICRHS